MKRILLACAAALVASSALGQACQRVVQIGAWNIQWLGNPASGKRPAQDAHDVASYIDASGVEILALAEISNTRKDGKKPPRNETLDQAFNVLNSTGAAWRYRLFEKRQGARDPEDQWLGIAWDSKKVKLVGEPWKLPVEVDLAREDVIRKSFPDPGDDTVIFSRWPHAIKFSAGEGLTDWVVVPVHMKSNTDGEHTIEARKYEAELLVSGLEALRPQHGDLDVIVLGDTNMLASSEPAGAILSQAGLRDCNKTDLGTHLPYKKGDKGAPFDRVFLNSNRPSTAKSCPVTGTGSGSMDFKVFRPGEWEAGTSNRDFKKLLSDHQLIRVGLCVGKDDD